MNYRHAFHAGGFADVLKHAILAQWITRLHAKDSPFVIIDAHAGIGRYDLTGSEAGRTLEWQDGIARLESCRPEAGDFLAPYLDYVRALNPGGTLKAYPGSPRVARSLLRRQDRLVAVELHPEDHARLVTEFAADRQVSIRHEDAYQTLRALLPPPERRGLVLIDPPFELKDEMERLVRGMTEALRRWPTGGYLIWYPIKDVIGVAHLQERLGAMAGRNALACDLFVREPADASKLNGSGLVLINPPWQFDEALRAVMPDLVARLAQGPGARASVGWLAQA
jgi:23S rRNA (adenine2030-N6)-methyltransferase